MFNFFRKKVYKENSILSEMPDNKKALFARIFYIDDFYIGHYCLAERTCAHRWICYDTNHRVRETITDDAEGFRIIKVLSGNPDNIRNYIYSSENDAKYKKFPTELEIPDYIKKKFKDNNPDKKGG